MNRGFIKLWRRDKTLELLKDTNAFGLLTIIALRARRTDAFNILGLTRGQALIGDHKEYGMSQRQYRTAKRRLTRYGLVRFKATSKGTVATLVDASIYDINSDPDGQANDKQATSKRQTDDNQATTNKNDKNEENDKNISPNADASRLADLFWFLIQERKADFRRPDLDRWAGDFQRLIDRDGRYPDRIEAVIRFCQNDPFWQNKILTPAALRKHFDRLELQMNQQPVRESIDEMVARMEREGKL